MEGSIVMKLERDGFHSCAVLRAATVLAVVSLLPAVGSAALTAPGVPLGVDATVWHPDVSVVPAGTKFSVYLGGPLGANGWASAASLDTDFTNGLQLEGTIRTEVWRNDADGHLLFAYQVENTGSSVDGRNIRVGNIAGYEGAIGVIDCGIIHPGGTDAFVQGDILALDRDAAPSVQFAFEAQQAAIVQKLLAPGEVSSWFYLETDASQHTTSVASIQDSGQSQANIAVLVPLVPEPATLSVLGIGLAGLIVRRRRGR
jgi:hypothetical protein